MAKDGKPDRRKYRQPKAIDIEALPCWDPKRHTMKVVEVPLFLKRLYGLAVSSKSVYMWAKHGLPAAEGNRRVYLRVVMILGRKCVRKKDLLAFLDVT